MNKVFAEASRQFTALVQIAQNLLYALAMLARVPGSSANLGPGFDTLAVALSIYLEVEIEPARALLVKTEGEGSDLPADESHLAVRIAKEVIGHDRFAIRVSSQIPVSRGMGSSAALAVAAAAAAGVDDPLVLANTYEGHPENAAASVMGGLVTATVVDGAPLATPLFLDPDLTFVLLIPSRSLPTKEARAVLDEHAPLEDAVFNLSRLGWLIAALGDASQLRPQVMEDRLHQDRRSPFFPEASQLLGSLVDAGAAASCWSGAGPSLLGLVVGEDRAERVRKAGEKAMHALGVDGEARVIVPDMSGLHVE